MTKHIGIVGVSYEGAALCYRTICQEGKDWLGMYEHPQVTMHTFNLNDYKKPSDADRWDLVGERILASAKILASAGADFLVCPDNTVHVSIDGDHRRVTIALAAHRQGSGAGSRGERLPQSRCARHATVDGRTCLST